MSGERSKCRPCWSRNGVGRALWTVVLFVVFGAPQARGEQLAAAAAPGRQNTLVILDTLDMESFHETTALVQEQGGEVPQAYPPNAFVATLDPEGERALRQHPAVKLLERGILNPGSIAHLRGQAGTAAHIWNTVFQGLPDPLAVAAPFAPVPRQEGPDFVVPPPEAPGLQSASGAPTSTQTSEFMAGKIVYSVIFVESSGTKGYCSPPDPQSENWDSARQSTVLAKISEGMAFWTSRANRPKPLSFVLDNMGKRPTSCEPITHGFNDSLDRGKWIADVLTAKGYPATPANHQTIARTLVNDRRVALRADWGILILVVDSFNDADGNFTDGRSAGADLNGPLQYLTYDNGGWGISRMHLVTRHETGHNFGALDEYAVSGCSTLDSWGYLNEANASCNNGGDIGDISVMGEGSELDNPAVDVSISARGALGWRNPSGNVVDVVRTATVSLTPFPADPTTDTTPTYSAVARNSPFPPGGCNTLAGTCYRTPTPVSISKVKNAQWKLDGGSFTSDGLTASDGAFDETTNEAYTFTPLAPVTPGVHTFQTRSINHFGHKSKVRKDQLTIQ